MQFLAIRHLIAHCGVRRRTPLQLRLWFYIVQGLANARWKNSVTTNNCQLRNKLFFIVIFKKFNTLLYYFIIVSPSTPINEQANHIRGQQTFITVSDRQPSNSLLAILKNILELKQWTIGGFTKRMGNLNSAFKKADSQWEQIFICRLESWQRTPINIISLVCFTLTAWEMVMTTSHQKSIL
jgi:hypothetical protein